MTLAPDVDVCTMVARLAWSDGSGWSPIRCGEPATFTNGKGGRFRLVACDGHASQFFDPTPIQGAPPA